MTANSMIFQRFTSLDSEAFAQVALSHLNLPIKKVHGVAIRANGKAMLWLETSTGYHCGWDGTRVITLERQPK